MLFTMRRCQDSTPTMTPPLQAPARGVDDGSGQQQNRATSDNRSNRAGTRDGEAKTTMATSTPLRRAAVRGVETVTDNERTDNNNNDDDGDQGTKTNDDEDNIHNHNKHKTTTGTGTDNDMT